MDDIVFEKKIVFCLLGKTFSSDFIRTWTEIVGYCLMNKIKPILSSAKSSEFNSKMAALSISGDINAPFGGKLDYDFIIYIKSDCLPSVNIVIEMIKHDLDVVSCLSSNERSLKHTNYIEDFELSEIKQKSYNYCKFEDIQDKMNKLNEYEASIRDASGNLKENIETIEKPSSLVKVNHVDFSVICIKNGVFEKLKLPWFNYEETSNDITGNLYFCNKCKQADVDILVDLNLLTNSERSVIC
tara:strand:- start:1 stop:726 length:726 start_codon:yes stop_codon:yes gene_type:complete